MKLKVKMQDTKILINAHFSNARLNEFVNNLRKRDHLDISDYKSNSSLFLTFRRHFV